MARKSTPERDALIAEVIEQMRRELNEQLPEQPGTLDQIEDTAGKIGRKLSQEVQKRLVEQYKQTPRPPKVDCACGATARYKGLQPRTLVTAHGSLTFARDCYYCPSCHQTRVPQDSTLGLDGGSTTTQIRLWVALLAGKLPFAEAASTLEMLTQVSLSAATLERLSVAMGTALRNEQNQTAQQHQANCLPEPTHLHPKRLYIGMDGAFVPLRDAWKKDQSAGDLTCRYGECKSGVVYQTYQDPQGKDHRVKAQAYVSTLAPVETFGPLIGALAHQQGHHTAKEVIVIGDGAPWIWQIAAKQFTGAIQIVDFFHAMEHLAKVAEARFGKETPESKAWLSVRAEELKTNQLRKVLLELRAWRPSSKTKQQLRRSTFAYFATNAERMRYQTFLEAGYHIGSGVVEATCKRVVIQRLDQAGMHWRQESAEAIVALRSAQLSTCPPDMRPYCAMPA